MRKGSHQLWYRVTTTIIAPSFLTAAVFNILGITIRRVGTQYSWISPRWCTSAPFPAPFNQFTSYSPVDLIIFMSLDLSTLIVQAIGGGKASIAAQDGQDPEPGGDIMMYGIIVQMVGITLVCPLPPKRSHLVNSHPPPVLHPQCRLPLPILLEQASPLNGIRLSSQQ